ncbi:MAG: mechanosensitive ion channel family protein [Patescibacteria group bacterium]
MDTRLLAFEIFKTKTNLASGIAERTSEIDYAGIAVNIFLKFMDVLEGAIVIVAGIFAVKLLKSYFQRIETTHERQRTVLNLLEKITSGFLIAVAITLGLKVIGLDLTLLISVLTLGLSFGLRDVIKNYVAGLLILFKSPFEIGDIVKIRSFTGRIEKIEFQSVTLRTFDQKEVTIHNSDLLTQPLTNFSRSQQMRLEMSMMMGYGSDLQRAVKIFDRILQNNSLVLKTPKYSIVFKEFTRDAMSVLIRFWVQRPCNPLKIRSELAMQIQEAFDDEKIYAPYAREAGLAADFAMTEARKERLKTFYGQFADIATQTIEQVAAAAPAAIGSDGQPIPTAAPVEEYADAEEPE